MVSESYCKFQVFQLTTLFLCGPVEEIPQFALNLDRVTISGQAIESANWCIQSFVWNPLFTQRDFFTDNETSMPVSAAIVAYSVCEDSLYDLWNCVLPEGHDAVVRVLKRAYDVNVGHRKDAQDTSERWFGMNSVESSLFGESRGQHAVRISNVVEVGDVVYLPESWPAPQIPSTNNSAKIPAEGKCERSETPTPVVPKRRYELDDEAVVLPKARGLYLDDPNFEIALKTQNKTATLLHLAEVVVVVVLRPSSSRILVNFILILFFRNSNVLFRVVS